MKTETIQIIAWVGLFLLIVAIYARGAYLRIVRRRWPVVDAKLENISGELKTYPSGEIVGSQSEYTHDLLYTYKGTQYKRSLTYPKIRKETLKLRVNPSNPTEAYFDDDVAQRVTHIRSEVRDR